MTVCVYPLVFPDRHPPASANPAGVAIALALYFGVAAFVITALCAFPTVLWIARRWRVHLPVALLFGLAFSNAPVLLAMASGGGGRDVHVFASVLGLLGAATFWFISIRGRDFSRDSAVA